MKNIILIIFALVLGVVGVWAQTALPNSSATLINGTIYTATTQTINGTLTVPENGTVTIYIPAGITLTINGEDGTNSTGVSISHPTGTVGQPGKPAINVPDGSTLIITGYGTLKAKGGRGGNGSSGTTGNGGSGAAPAIGGIGGVGGKGWNSSDDKNGKDGESMGNVYILDQVSIEAQKGAQGERHEYIFTGGEGGKAPNFSIGGGGAGGRSANGTDGNNGNNGNLYIQNTATVSYKDSQGNTDTSRPDVNVVPPTKTGYTFYGYNIGSTWVFDANGSIKDGVTSYSGSISEYWGANEYTVALDLQGGTGGTSSVTATYDSAMPSATAPTRTGYTFAGYYTSPNGGGTQFYDENMVSVSYWNITTNPSTLYANWTANTYTLNFDVQNGDALSPSTQSVTYDAAYGTLPTPTRYGFAFKGWYTTPNGGSETDTEVLTSDIYSIDGDQTIYAHWNTIVVDIDAYSAEEQLTDNYFRTFYDSQIAHILPDGVKAYKGKIEGNYLVLTAIEAKDDDDNDIIPKNVPVILRMMPNEEAGVPIPGNLYQIKTKQISLTTSESELTIDNTDNELIGSDIVIVTAVANSYILSFGSNGLGFYEWSTHPLEAHKAYVIKDSANPAKALTFRFEDDVTGINDAIKDFMFNDSNMVIYNLNGIRLSKPQKGLNIINGRKVWVK